MFSAGKLREIKSSSVREIYPLEFSSQVSTLSYSRLYIITAVVTKRVDLQGVLTHPPYNATLTTRVFHM